MCSRIFQLISATPLRISGDREGAGVVRTLGVRTSF